MLEVVHHDGAGQTKESDAPQRRADAGLHIIDYQSSFDTDRDGLTINGKLPAIKELCRLAKQDAREVLQVLGQIRSAPPVEKSWRAADDEGLGGRQPPRDHVHLDKMADTNPRVESFRNDIDQSVLALKFQLNIG